MSERDEGKKRDRKQVKSLPFLMVKILNGKN